jgi:hypothetical protein
LLVTAAIDLLGSKAQRAPRTIQVSALIMPIGHCFVKLFPVKPGPKWC